MHLFSVDLHQPGTVDQASHKSFHKSSNRSKYAPDIVTIYASSAPATSKKRFSNPLLAPQPMGINDSRPLTFRLGAAPPAAGVTLKKLSRRPCEPLDLAAFNFSMPCTAAQTDLSRVQVKESGGCRTTEFVRAES
jgi:hypothetical protein